MSSTKFTCLQCNVTFGRRDNLRRHEKIFHGLKDMDYNCNQICAACNEKCRTILDLHKHIQKEHPDITLEFHKKLFYCQSDFKQWKEEIERETKSFFALNHTRTKEDGATLEYKCNRSGIPKYKDPAERKSTRKIKKSIKSGITCPAIMKMTKETHNEAIEISVEYQSTHMGHSSEMPYPKKKRLRLANALSVEISKCAVVDNIEEQDSQTIEISPTNEQDNCSVVREFNVSNTALKDAMAVHITVCKMKSQEYNPVLVYKPVGEKLEHYPKIKKEEFLLGLSNEAQIDLLKSLGENCVMFDSTYSTIQYGVFITTLFVLDKYNESLPVAIFFSTRISTETFRAFFNDLKTKLPNFKTNILMSADTTTFLNAWHKTFQDNAKHLFCSWHVMKSFSNYVKAKVKDRDKRIKIKKDFEILLQEEDIATFESYLETFLISYEEEEIFIKNFVEHYVPRREKWAYCYRAGLGVNKDMRIERWHKQIKYEEAAGAEKQLSKSITVILQTMSKKLLGPPFCIQGAKLNKWVNLIRKIHNEASKMEDCKYSVIKMNASHYVVSKIQGQLIIAYDVEVENINCNCTATCTECGICIHTFRCTCVDYTISFQICKHIHVVCKMFKLSGVKETDNRSIHDAEECLIIDVFGNQISHTETVILKRINNTSRKNLSNKKHMIEECWQNISTKLQSIESLEMLSHVHEQLENINTYLDCNKSIAQ